MDAATLFSDSEWNSAEPIPTANSSVHQPEAKRQQSGRTSVSKHTPRPAAIEAPLQGRQHDREQSSDSERSTPETESISSGLSVSPNEAKRQHRLEPSVPNMSPSRRTSKASQKRPSRQQTEDSLEAARAPMTASLTSRPSRSVPNSLVRENWSNEIEDSMSYSHAVLWLATDYVGCDSRLQIQTESLLRSYRHAQAQANAKVSSLPSLTNLRPPPLTDDKLLRLLGIVFPCAAFDYDREYVRGLAAVNARATPPTYDRSDDERRTERGEAGPSRADSRRPDPSPEPASKRRKLVKKRDEGGRAPVEDSEEQRERRKKVDRDRKRLEREKKRRAAEAASAE